MAFIVDFTIKYRSDDEKCTSEILVSATKSYKNHKFSNIEPHKQKKV